MARRLFEAQTLWGFWRCLRAEGEDAWCRPACDGGDRGPCVVDRAVQAAVKRITTLVCAAPGKAWSGRGGLMTNPRPVQALVSGADHDGGARIAWPRVKVCSTIIAWPQCRQTKVGADVVTPSPQLSMAADTGEVARNSSRASAKLALRLPLASSP